MRNLMIPFSVLTFCTILPLQAAPPTYSVHDLDRDGYLSREEYASLQTHCHQRRSDSGRGRCDLLEFEVLDDNQDGRIDEDELLKTLRHRNRGGRNR